MAITRIETINLDICCDKCDRVILALESCRVRADGLEALERAFIVCGKGECEEENALDDKQKEVPINDGLYLGNGMKGDN